MNNNYCTQNSDLPAAKKIKINLLDYVVLLIFIFPIFFTGCQKDEDFTKSLPACPFGAVFKVSPVAPEDPHLSLILNNFDPRKNVISMGTSVPGIPSLAYEFYPEESGIHNRAFNKITNDGKIYTFSSFVNIWDQPITDFQFPSENVILMQLVDYETLRVEQQTDSDGPPWSFKNNFKDFRR